MCLMIVAETSPKNKGLDSGQRALYNTRFDDSDSTDSSLFNQGLLFYRQPEWNGKRENYATNFMGIVGGGICSHLKGNLNESLKRLFGSSSFGNAFEFS
jgi:hypothetical protein